MKVQCTLIISTLRGMAGASPWIPALSKSLGQTPPITFHPISSFGPINPNTFAYSTSAWKWTKEVMEWAKERIKRPMRDNDEDESFGKNVLSDAAKGNSEHGHDESSRAYNNNDEDESFGKNVLSDSAKGNSEHGHDESSRAYNSDEDGSFGKTVLSVTAKGNSEHGHDESSRAYNNDEDEGFGKNVLSETAKGNNEHGHDESSRAFPNYSRPRPENVPWQSCNRVYFTGMIGRPVEFKLTRSGIASARTSLAVMTRPEDEPMWLHLLFRNKLAETAAAHLTKYDIVHVSGFLKSQALPGEDGQQRIFYQVIAQRLYLIQAEAATCSQQVDVKGVDKEVGEDAAIQQSLWKDFFTNPDDWWDDRENKKNPRSSDFQHKDTGCGLWIDGRHTPPWVNSMLATWDSRKKVPEEYQRSSSSASSQGSSSFRDGDL